MQIYGQLQKAALEVLSSDPSGNTQGRVYYNSTTAKAMLDDGTNKLPLLRNDQNCVFGTNGTAASNVRFNRGAAGLLQFVLGSDTTAEGSLSTSLAQISAKLEGYAAASKPTAGNAGRAIWVTDSTFLAVDNGSAWKQVPDAGLVTTKGDLLVWTGSAFTRLAAGADGLFLQADSAQSSGLKFASPTSPVGSVIAFAGATAPAGYIVCDGSAVSRTTYAALFAAIGNTWGTGDGSTTFNLPDFRGQFLRGQGSTTTDIDSTTRTAPVGGTFTVGSGSTNGTSTITVASTAELVPGMTVTGTNIPASSVVRAILSSTTFTLGNYGNNANVNASGTSSGLTFTFSKSPVGNYVGSSQGNQIGVHNHSILGGLTGSTLPINNASTSAFCGLSSTSLTYYNTAQNGGNKFIQDTGGGETRPTNLYVLFCIKT